MIICAISIMSIATLITAISALLTGFYLWYDRRARIIVSIEPIDKVYYLIIENVGRSIARDVKIIIDNNYINSLPVSPSGEGKLFKEALQHIQQRKFYFAPGTKKYYVLIQSKKSQNLSEYDDLCNQWYDEYKYTPFRVDVSYNSWFEFSVEFFLDQFNSEASIPHTNEYLLLKYAESVTEIIKKHYNA